MKVLFILLLSIFGSASLCAQVDWSVAHKPVGAGPSEIFADSAHNQIHVLTSGVDADFNGIFEPGGDDISAAWYVLDPAGNVVDSSFFEGYFNSFPIRVGVNLKEGIMYAPVNGTVQSYSLQTLKPLGETLIDENFAAAAYDSASGMLILSARAADFSSPGEIVYFDPQTQLEVGRVRAGVNPGNGIADPRPDIDGIGFYSINEGGFGQADASLTYTTFSSNLFASVNGKPLGGGGADLLVDGFRAYLLMGGSHQVRIVETETHQEVSPSPIEIGTEGFDAARSLALAGDTLIVGTYSSDVRRFNAKTGALIDVIPMPGKVESVAVVGSSIFAAIAYTAGTYDADSLLVVIDMVGGLPTDTLVVGGQPAAVLANPENGSVTVVGYGAGENSTPWWKTVDAATLATDAEGTLSQHLSYPFRPAMNAANNNLMFVGSDTLFGLNVSVSNSTPEPVYTDPTASGNLFGVSDGGDYWYVTERPTDFASFPGYLHAIRKSSGVRDAKFITGGAFLLTAAPVPSSATGGSAAYLLHEGNFGSTTDATLSFADYVPEAHKGVMGSGANYIMHDVDEYGTEITAVTMTGSHEVLFVDFTEDGFPAITSRVPTGTTDLDGPRQCVIAPCVPVIFQNPLLVTTYSGQALLLANGTVVSSHEIGGKGEGITKLGDKVYTANSFETGTYTAGSTVSIISLIYSSVEETGSVAGTTLAQNYPNPANGRTTIPFTLSKAGDVSLDLYSATGALTATLLHTHLQAGKHDLTISTADLPSGTYIYRLTLGNQTFTEKMEVVR